MKRKRKSQLKKKKKKEEDGRTPVVAMNSKNSNWDNLKSQILGDGKAKAKREMREERSRKKSGQSSVDNTKFSPQARRENRQETRIVGLDCEMVGIGESGHKSVLARVVVINNYGNVLIDTYCAPKQRVTDYRTRVSGIKPSQLKNAPKFDQVQQRVANLLRGKVVVGHALKNDFKALQIKHPRHETRDTATYGPLRIKTKSRALKELAAEHLGLEIQHGQHSPVEDARAALYLYQKHKVTWEREIHLQGQKGKGKRRNPAMGEPSEERALKEKFKLSAGVSASAHSNAQTKAHKVATESPGKPKPEYQGHRKRAKRDADAKKEEEEESGGDGYGLDLLVSE